MLNKKALIIVDLQNDFCQNGSLAVPGGDEVVPLANALLDHFDLIVATQDWHPPDHVSFAANHPGHQVGDIIIVDGISQVLWPIHCVQNTHGAAFHPHFHAERVHKIIHKGIDKNIDSYSAFFDNKHLRATGLAEYLRACEIKKVFIMGLALEYCVKYSSLDAVKLGFDVTVICDACRGIESSKGNIEKTINEIQEAGIKIIQSDEF